LNRWGECPQAHGYVLRIVEEKEEEPNESLTATRNYLHSLPQANGWIDVSGYTLYRNPAPEPAFSRPPHSLILNEAIVAQLANTSTKHEILVEQYIRGKNFEYHVNLVIRKHQELNAIVKMSNGDLQNYVAAVPILTSELFKEPVVSSLLNRRQACAGSSSAKSRDLILE